MADITMCINTECPMSNNCYRLQAKPNDCWQSYSNFEHCNENSEFEDYIPIKSLVDTL